MILRAHLPRAAAPLLWLALLCPSLPAAAVRDADSATVERWGIFELTLPGPSGGNPFTEVELSADFTLGGRTVRAAGFYDGDGIFRIRFMPETAGPGQYVTASNRPELHGKRGAFTVTPASAGNRGPVRVRNTFHFAYADGTPYRQIGTTSYAWPHQGDSLEEQTLKTLAEAPFNKVRMGVFPKRYDWNRNEPILYPFKGTPPRTWDLSRFNPAFFRHLEQRVGQLRDLGIEADLILFHPYDKGHWGFDRMAPDADDRYLRYVVARLAAYRNVWWSLANEFDFMSEKATEDWDRLFQIVQASDPYAHLRSIHNGSVLYNHTRPWVTHVSIQNGSAVEDYGRAVLYRDVYRKPVVFDEVKYEGNIHHRWGNLPAEEMVHRFWQGTVAGTYVGHGETYLHPEEILWWSRGGVLHGQSPPRLAFLRAILAESPDEGLEPIDKWQNVPFAGTRGQYYLGYFGRDARTEWPFELFRAGLADGMTFSVEVIDTWAMTVTPVPGVFTTRRKDAYTFADTDGRRVPLPGRPYMALRIRRVASPAVPIPASAPPAAPSARTIKDLEYGRAGGEAQRLDVSVPDGPGPFPVAILVHGGGWTAGDKAGTDRPGSASDITPWFAPFTDATFTWFSINYRLAPRHRWPAPLDDVLAAIRWVKAHAAEFKGDPTRIALVGHSAGGHLAAMAATVVDDSVRVQAVVGYAPVTSFEHEMRSRGELGRAQQGLLHRVRDLTPESLGLLRAIAPRTHARPGLPPFLLIHGDADTTVPLQQSVEFQAALRAAGVRCDLIVVPGAAHRLTDWHRHLPDHGARVTAWLRDVLGAVPR